MYFKSISLRKVVNGCKVKELAWAQWKAPAKGHREGDQAALTPVIAVGITEAFSSGKVGKLTWSSTPHRFTAGLSSFFPRLTCSRVLWCLRQKFWKLYLCFWKLSVFALGCDFTLSWSWGKLMLAVPPYSISSQGSPYSSVSKEQFTIEFFSEWQPFAEVALNFKCGYSWKGMDRDEFGWLAQLWSFPANFWEQFVSCCWSTKTLTTRGSNCGETFESSTTAPYCSSWLKSDGGV